MGVKAIKIKEQQKIFAFTLAFAWSEHILTLPYRSNTWRWIRTRVYRSAGFRPSPTRSSIRRSGSTRSLTQQPELRSRGDPDPELTSVRNYRATSGWRVSTHVGAQGWSLWETRGRHQAGGWVHMYLEGEYTCGSPGLISVRNYRATSGWRVSTHVGAQGWSLWETRGRHQAGGWVHMWGPRADPCEKLQGNIRLEGEYPCGVQGLISVRNYRATSGWRVSTHVGTQGWSLWETTLQHQAGGWVPMWGPRADLCEKLHCNIRLEGEYPYGGLGWSLWETTGQHQAGGWVPILEGECTCTWRVSTHVGSKGWSLWETTG